ncbi:hypothetical protein HYH03_008849 [Edaphochlamys debaryana]|uniref:Uncharacterized protein n=1 Tax=Edaphochlamys debaryana TaxID=47281 RepID=A0A836BXN4_9CHLO|nr:hypothetical protein HYH03_008849 [Edaphochlamys debaryana]|eukprot:KAG2492941.1 hypothetical protein HYH03_008849 [Edaphochlamys debaryana]
MSLRGSRDQLPSSGGICLPEANGCALNPGFVASLPTPATAASRLLAWNLAADYRCRTFGIEGSCVEVETCAWLEGEGCRLGRNVQPGPASTSACPGSLADREIRCEASAASASSCPTHMGCVWRTREHIAAAGVTADGGPDFDLPSFVEAVFRQRLLGSGRAGPIGEGLCTSAALWQADFAALAASLAPLLESSGPGFAGVPRQALALARSDLYGSCTAAFAAATASADAGSSLDSFYLAYAKAVDTCRRATPGDCEGEGGPMHVDAARLEALLRDLPSPAEAQASE